MLSSSSPLRTLNAAATVAAPETEPAETDADAGSAAVEVPDLTGMTKAQLLATASELGVEGVSSRNNKAEIIAAIEAVMQ